MADDINSECPEKKKRAAHLFRLNSSQCSIIYESTYSASLTTRLAALGVLVKYMDVTPIPYW